MAEQTEVPEYYADQFTVTAGAYGVALTFALSPPHPAPGQASPPRPIARVRMSLEHAKVMAMILRKHLRGFEHESGITIPLPAALLNAMGLSQEDW